MKLYLSPDFGDAPDNGDGGVRRVVEAQRRWLSEYGIELVDEPRLADVLAYHILADMKVLNRYPELPLVCHNHGVYWAEIEWPSWCKKANMQCMELLRQADVITAPSEWVAQSIRRNTRRQVTPIGHGINLDEWPEQPPREGGYVLWNKTRVDPICIPGEVNKLAEMATSIPFVSTYGNQKLPNMTVTGRLPYEDAKKFVQEAGVYLITPRETFGIGILEAMASEVPVLGWRWGGQVDIIEHKETGWLSEPGDFDDLVQGLIYCLQNRVEMGRAARKIVEERYQWKDVVGEYAKLYLQLYEKEEHPKVSIVVPAYDLEEFLSETLDSVRKSSFQDWECIIVDDASPDRCGAIADEYAESDKRFSVIHNPTNQYLAGALNTGIAAATGKYIFPLDADNLLPEFALTTLVEALDDDRSLCIAYGNVEFLDHPEGKRWHSGWPPEFRTDWQVLRRDTEIPSNLIPSSSLYRKKVWELTGGYRTRYRTAEDADFWTRATSYGFRAKRVTEGDVLVYRNRESSMSRDEKMQDWTNWFPWSRNVAAPPAAIAHEPQVPIPSYDPVTISIVIPVGPGHEKFLTDALDSVDAQVYRSWECIIVNDTNKPLPDLLLPSWARVINTTGEIGVAAARNLGIREAKGRLFLPLDADDTIESEALVHMIRTQEKFGGYVYCDWFKREKDKPTEVWNTSDYDAELLISKGSLHAVTALYLVADWKLVGGFDPNLSAWEDWDFQLALANIGCCGTRIPKPLFTYRVDTGTRREENFTEFEKSKRGILDKWGPYFREEETLMGCRSCPRGGNGRVAAEAPPPMNPAMATRNPPPEHLEKYTVIEYTGPKQGIFTIRGQSSGIPYRFANLHNERTKYVLKDDVPLFEARMDFKVVEFASPA